ncbi:n-acyl homoserine lactonase attm [Fusarium sporotrichioides]|uniref:N-acyl homoserine lactonase attm n=1 Tax=Fusarium sporotrichioides TaxID=5514 RepID=A0A395RH65_FUSSP|nr:n-acyl homoserine lactonase attm [Fusarium sporotrichioides]
MESEKDVDQILQEDGNVSLDEVSKKALLPGYPADPNGVILESDYTGRQLREIEFIDESRMNALRAFDFFGDGSFYLLDSPGHAVGHMCGLARTSSSTFVFMGGDGCHHCGSLRPSKYVALPDQVSPSPFSVPPHLQNTICPDALLEAINPKSSRTKPYYSHLEQAHGRDVAKAADAIDKMIAFDASEDVFVILAHDKTLVDVIDYFPKSANGWKDKGWKETTRWRFIEDFKGALPHGTDVQKLPLS